MRKQTLFSEEELARVATEDERNHLIDCTIDQSSLRHHRQLRLNV